MSFSAPGEFSRPKSPIIGAPSLCRLQNHSVLRLHKHRTVLPGSGYACSRIPTILGAAARAATLGIAEELGSYIPAIVSLKAHCSASTFCVDACGRSRKFSGLICCAFFDQPLHFPCLAVATFPVSLDRGATSHGNFVKYHLHQQSVELQILHIPSLSRASSLDSHQQPRSYILQGPPTSSHISLQLLRHSHTNRSLALTLLTTRAIAWCIS